MSEHEARRGFFTAVSIRRSMSYLRALWWIIAIGCIGGGLLAILASLVVTPSYKSTATLYLTTPSDSNAASAAYQGSLASQQRVASYIKLAKSDVVVQSALDRTGIQMSLTDAQSAVSAVSSVNTVIVSISAVTDDPVVSALLANGLSESMIDYVKKLEMPDGGGVPLAKLTVISPAVPGSSPVEPVVSRWLAIGVVFGGLFGALIVVAWRRLDSSIRGEGEMASVIGAPVLGVIPEDGELAGGGPVIFSRGASAVAEAFRKLRTNLTFVRVDDALRVLVVSSSVAGEGKTTTCMNLGACLAEAGKSVVLVDADLRRPTLASRLSVDGSVGLTTVLADSARLEDAISTTALAGLDLVASGVVPPNPAELAGSDRLGEVLRALERKYDYVLIDAPPVLSVTDAVLLSHHTQGILLVARAGSSRVPDLQNSVSQIGTAGGSILGGVLNAVPSVSYEYGYYREPVYGHAIALDN